MSLPCLKPFHGPLPRTVHIPLQGSLQPFKTPLRPQLSSPPFVQSNPSGGCSGPWPAHGSLHPCLCLLLGTLSHVPLLL